MNETAKVFHVFCRRFNSLYRGGVDRKECQWARSAPCNMCESKVGNLQMTYSIYYHITEVIYSIPRFQLRGRLVVQNASIGSRVATPTSCEIGILTTWRKALAERGQHALSSAESSLNESFSLGHISTVAVEHEQRFHRGAK